LQQIQNYLKNNTTCITIDYMTTDIPQLTSDEWQRITQLVKTRAITVHPSLIQQIKTGHRSLTERLAIAIHRATNGQIPCWRTRPNTWPVGVLPPCLQVSDDNPIQDEPA
jgi:hypothetical protein